MGNFMPQVPQRVSGHLNRKVVSSPNHKLCRMKGRLVPLVTIEVAAPPAPRFTGTPEDAQPTSAAKYVEIVALAKGDERHTVTAKCSGGI